MFDVKAAVIKKMECPEPPSEIIKGEVKKETIGKQENNNELIDSYNGTDVKNEIQDPFDCSSDESKCENDDNPFGEDIDENKITDFKETSKVNINMVTEKAPVLTDKVGRKQSPPNFLQKHYTILPNSGYCCKHCKFVSKKRKYMYKHVRTIHLKIGKVYQCPYCPYNSRFMIQSHITSRHTKESEIKWYTCNECGHKSKLRSGLQKHLLTHKTNEERMDKMKKCELCHKIYRDQMGLAKHIRMVHERNQAMLKCSMCEYQTLIKMWLERHIKKFHSDGENMEMFKCDKCNYTTLFEYSLKAHSRKHLPKKFQCEKCPYQAYDMGHMKLHQINHQEVKNEKDLKYRCDNCDYKTYRQYSLQVHKLKHLKPEEIQYFYCYHCDFKAKRKDNLKTHIQNHFKKKTEFVCFVCDFKTNTKASHIAHLGKHSKEQHEKLNDCENQGKKILVSSSIGPQKKTPSRGIKKNSTLDAFVKRR